MSKSHDSSYDLYEELGSLSKVLAEYQAWFVSVTERACFGDVSKKGDVLKMPSLFVESVTALPEPEYTDITKGELEVLHLQHHNIENLAQKLVETSAPGYLPDHEIFHKFSEQFQDFIKGLQKTCQSLILEEWGLDVLTGLKNKRAMNAELKQEMERLSRHGQAFSLALVQVDDFHDIFEKQGRDEADRLLKKAASHIAASLRSFDGAYNIGNGEFVLSLKQAGLNGGQKAIERVCNELEYQDVSFFVEGQKKQITMSCCVSEPLAEDDLQILLTNMRTDLETHKNHSRESGTVLAYFEMSPLQQFMKSGQAD